MGNILVVDDEPKIRHILRVMLSLRGYNVDDAGDGQEALAMVQEKAYDIVISDIRMPEMDGITFIEKVQAMEIPPPVVFITAYATVDSAVEAMKRGAIDYITKPFDESRIILTVEKAIGIGRIISENRQLKKDIEKVEDSKIVFASQAMNDLLGLARRVAEKPDTSVLITGESGTGKELIASFIHKNSPRARRRFVPVNCAAISSHLVESVLFGHERGAFTGADRRKEGFFEYANSGTLFLDEAGDLPLEAQAKLLRALQEKVIQRVGGNASIPVDVRVVCATNQDLLSLVKEGRFREDLYYRINVFPLHIPPLRKRRDDIIPLAEHFIRNFREKAIDADEVLSQGAKRILLCHNWPGNVRELSNTMERVVIFAGERMITADDLSFLAPLRGGLFDGTAFTIPEEGISLEDLERDIIRQALSASGENQSAAARLLGLTRSKFRTRLKQLEDGQ